MQSQKENYKYENQFKQNFKRIQKSFFLFPRSWASRTRSSWESASKSLIRFSKNGALERVRAGSNKICLGYLVKKERISRKVLKESGFLSTSEHRQGVLSWPLRSQNFSQKWKGFLQLIRIFRFPCPFFCFKPTFHSCGAMCCQKFVTRAFLFFQISYPSQKRVSQASVRPQLAPYYEFSQVCGIDWEEFLAREDSG